MGVIDGEQFFAALAHLALSFEEIFGRGLVTHFRLRRNVPKAIEALSVMFGAAADEATTFLRRHLARVSNHGVEVFAK